MKKTSTIVMALALLMAMTQCKKNESTVDANNTGETVNIMLEVGNDDGSRVIVNPALGTVKKATKSMLVAVENMSAC